MHYCYQRGRFIPSVEELGLAVGLRPTVCMWDLEAGRVFLRDPRLYLNEFRRKTRKTPNICVVKRNEYSTRHLSSTSFESTTCRPLVWGFPWRIKIVCLRPILRGSSHTADSLLRSSCPMLKPIQPTNHKQYTGQFKIRQIRSFLYKV